MFSGLQAWRGGARLWSVIHGPEEGVDGLDVTGEPPKDWAKIETRLTTRQAEEKDAVDHLFDAPLELGEQICGFRPDQPYPQPWVLLAPAKLVKEPLRSSLPSAIRAELLPGLAELGWTVASIHLPSNGRAYDASRIRNGRLEAVTFLWRDDRRDLEVIPSFAMLAADRLDEPVFVSASVHRRRPSLLQRIRSWRLGQSAKTYDEKVREAIAEARADLASIDDAIDQTALAESVADPQGTNVLS